MNNIQKLIRIIILIYPILGCTIAGEPKKQWDFQSSNEDMELTIKKYQALTPEEGQKYEDRLNDLNYKWHIDLSSRADEASSYQISDKDREQAINQLIGKSLREGGSKIGTGN
jgi:hypothetical protein